MLASTPYLDPVTQEWVFPDGHHLPLIAGGSAIVHDDLPEGKKDDGDDADIDGADSDDGDDDEPEDDDWDPPSKNEWERIQSALKNERRQRRADKREFQERVQNMSTEGTAAAQVEIEKVRIETEQKMERKWVKRTVQALAEAAFVDAGASRITAERLAKIVDLDKVTFDERANEWDGLDDEIEELMSEHVDSFKKEEKKVERDDTPVVRRPRMDGASRGARGGTNRPRRTSAEKLADIALGKAARRR